MVEIIFGVTVFTGIIMALGRVDELTQALV